MDELSQDYSQFYNEHLNPPLRELDSNKPELQHPDFYGNPEHLKAFIQLANTPLRSLERNKALRQWKLSNRLPQTDESGLLIKGAPRFRGFDLRGADLHHIYLGYVDLRGALFDDVNMTGVRMKGAWFDGARFKNSRLSCGFFQNASFAGADLTQADLTDANLKECKLIDANFNSATLTGALLQDTQHRGWNLKGVSCEYIYWEQCKPPTKYSEHEFEELYSEERTIEFDIAGKIHSFTVASLPEIIQAFKTYTHSELNLIAIENINGVNRFRFAINGKNTLSESQIENQLSELKSLLKEHKAENIIYNFNTTVTGDIKQLNQGAVINTRSTISMDGEQNMANFSNNITNNGQMTVNQADTINNTSYQDISINKAHAQDFMDVLETKAPEKAGFTADIKQEIKSALTALIKEETRVLTGKAYKMIKEFFPSYIKVLLP